MSKRLIRRAPTGMVDWKMVVFGTLATASLIIADKVLRTNLMLYLGQFIHGEEGLTRIVIISLLWISVYILQTAVYYYFSFQIYKILSGRVYDKIRWMEESRLTEYGSGKVHTVANNDVNTAMKLFLDYPSMILSSVVVMIYTAGVIYQGGGVMLLYPIGIFSLIYLFLGFYLTNLSRSLYHYVRETFRQRQNFITTLIRESTFIKVSLPNSMFLKIMKDIIEAYRQRIMRWAVLSSSREILSTVLMLMCTVLSVVLIGSKSPSLSTAMLGIVPVWWTALDGIISGGLGIAKARDAYKNIEEMYREEEGRPLRLSVPSVVHIVSVFGKHVPIDIPLERGKAVVIKGANGVGKSSLLRSLTGSLKMKKGSIPEGNARVYYMPQDTLIISGTLRENILLGREVDWDTVEDTMKKIGADKVLGRLNMDMHLHPDRNILSGGQKRVLDIVRGLLSDADVYLLDEPDSGVDPESLEIVKSAIRLLKERNKVVLFVSHTGNLSDVADEEMVLIPDY